MAIGLGQLAIIAALSLWLRAARAAQQTDALGLRWILSLALWLGAGLLGPAILCFVFIGGFPALRLIYHAGAFSAVTATGILAWSWGKHRDKMTRWTKRALLALMLGVAMVPQLAIWMTFVEPYRLTVERTTLKLAPSHTGQHPLRIAVISDLQTPKITAWEERIALEVKAQAPDLILIPGDVLQTITQAEFEQRLPQMRRFLNGLSAPGGVYLVSGDVDRDVRALVVDTQIKVIDNKLHQLSYKDREITIAGVPLEYWTQPSIDLVDRLESAPARGQIKLVLAHRPDAVMQALPNKGPSQIDLFITGHTHGGQINIPGFGPPVTMTHVPREVAAGGLHQLAGRAIYVSRGLGAERGYAPLLRLNCPPELSIITLQ